MELLLSIIISLGLILGLFYLGVFLFDTVLIPLSRREPQTLRFFVIIYTIWFLFVGIVLLISVQKISIRSRPEEPTPRPRPVLIVNLNPSKIEIVTDTPTSMQINQSYEVKVSLIPKGQTIVSTLTIEKATAVPSDVISVGTPSATLQNAFGPGYEVTAIATLSPNNGPFKITPIGLQEQPLDQPSVTWKWIVIPVEQGPQMIMDVDIEAIWTSAHNLQHQARMARIGDKQFSIQVIAPASTPEPFITPGQIKIGDLITSIIIALVGAGGLVSLFIVWLVKRSNRKNHTAPKPTKSKTNKRRGRH